MAEARGVIPGGVNSPVRAYRGVGGTPTFIQSAEGCRVVDADGNRYVDLVLAYGPLLLGHNHPKVTAAITAALARGTAFGAPTEAEITIAKKIHAYMPWVEMVRLVNSGTEATMSALRVARAFTGRSAFIKFNGCYHGHGDAFLVKAGSGALTHGAPDSPGVPEGVAKDTLVASTTTSIRSPRSSTRIRGRLPPSSSSPSPATSVACCRGRGSSRACANSAPATARSSSSTK